MSGQSTYYNGLKEWVRNFLCPISLELMRDPVIVSSRQTYERSYIQECQIAPDNVIPSSRNMDHRMKMYHRRAMDNRASVKVNMNGNTMMSYKPQVSPCNYKYEVIFYGALGLALFGWILFKNTLLYVKKHDSSLTSFEAENGNIILEEGDRCLQLSDMRIPVVFLRYTTDVTNVVLDDKLRFSHSGLVIMGFDGSVAFMRSSAKSNLSSSCNVLPSCALVKTYTISEFTEALTPL
ncbi:GPI ethanolamine phosphate transferase 1 [Tanacetum coccineum]|uniref:GPI ethanolamine phosphate transferase 1 n=1 Tax=Tanacetum coccineum TaxID=301880 RepID=A0ABQ5BUM2_9ASTR